MTRQVWPGDPRLKRLLLAFLRMARTVRQPYAIGGALGMAAHGYARHTTDLDVYLPFGTHVEWLRAARSVGLLTRGAFIPHHYLAWFEQDVDSSKPLEEEPHIDLMLPVDELDVAGRESARDGSFGGVHFQVMAPEMLAILKHESDRPKDRHDFEELLDRKLFEPVAARIMLQSVDPAAARRFAADVARRASRASPRRSWFLGRR